jgi:hypothetical protein
MGLLSDPATVRSGVVIWRLLETRLGGTKKPTPLVLSFVFNNNNKNLYFSNP